jgi:hypothetical protein
MPERLDEEELADWRAGRNAIADGRYAPRRRRRISGDSGKLTKAAHVPS